MEKCTGAKEEECTDDLETSCVREQANRSHSREAKIMECSTLDNTNHQETE